MGRDTGQLQVEHVAKGVRNSHAYATTHGAQDCLTRTFQLNLDRSGIYVEFQNPHMPAMPQSNIHLDILMGRDQTLEPVDFMSNRMYKTHPSKINQCLRLLIL